MWFYIIKYKKNIKTVNIFLFSQWTVVVILTCLIDIAKLEIEICLRLCSFSKVLFKKFVKNGFMLLGCLGDKIWQNRIGRTNCHSSYQWNRWGWALEHRRKAHWTLETASRVEFHLYNLWIIFIIPVDDTKFNECW